MVTIRYWAAAREAAGLEEEKVEASTLAEALDAVRAAHADRASFARVLGICSFLIDERPVGRRDPATVELADGARVEALPPFAGGARGPEGFGVGSGVRDDPGEGGDLRP